MAALIAWLTGLSAVAASCTAGLWMVLRREREAAALVAARQARRIRGLVRELAQARAATRSAHAQLIRLEAATSLPRMAAGRTAAPVGLSAAEERAWLDIVPRLGDPRPTPSPLDDPQEPQP